MVILSVKPVYLKVLNLRIRNQNKTPFAVFKSLAEKNGYLHQRARQTCPHENTFITRVTAAHEASPVRGQLHNRLRDVAWQTEHLESQQVSEVVLDCIAPGQSQVLFQLTTSDKMSYNRSSSLNEHKIV